MTTRTPLRAPNGQFAPRTLPWWSRLFRTLLVKVLG